jgi:hypothetical protein
LKSAYSQPNDKEAKLLFLKIQKWKYSKTKNKKNSSEDFDLSQGLAISP